tara:strand:+ start:140 stop:283 length:144 start_codon:yes stop_codon:yes gene_type:complete
MLIFWLSLAVAAVEVETSLDLLVVAVVPVVLGIFQIKQLQQIHIQSL